MHLPLSSVLIRGTIILGTLGCNVNLGHAQASGCTYDLCAVRLQSGRIVQGIGGKRIASLGIFSSRIPVFEQASDSVRAHYTSFRSAERTGALLEVVALAAMTTGLVLITDRGNSTDAGQVVFFAGLGVSFGGRFAIRSAANHLSQAVWWYNRALARSP